MAAAGERRTGEIIVASIILKNINKIYPNKVHAVYDFNLEIKDKEFVVFVGPSGCGKSTTLRMIAGLEDISTGEYYIDGKLMNYVPSCDRNVAMVFQNYALYPHMTVYRNMAYGLTIRKGYHEIYQKDPAIDALLKQIKSEKKDLVALQKKISADEESASLKEQYEITFQHIEELLDEVIAKRKPVTGLDQKRIARLKKSISSLGKEEKYVLDLMEQEKQSPYKDKEFGLMLEQDLANVRQTMKEKQEELNLVATTELPLQKYRHLYRYEIDKEVYHAAKILDLSPYLSRFPAALSGGQRQRVALGRAIVRRPKVFLMDEPLSNLDAKLRVQTRGEIAALHRRIGATTIYVTHDQTEAMTLADRIVVMKDGRVQQIDPPMKTFEDPNNMFVAGFIGSPAMNFFEGVFDGENILLKGNESEEKLPLTDEQRILLQKYKGEKVVVGLRPDWMGLENGTIEIKVSSVELLGTESVVYGKLGGKRIAVKSNKTERLDEETTVKVSFPMERALFFDADTTMRIRGNYE